MNEEKNRDEHIAAYLDGEMAQTQRLAFEKDMLADPALAVRVSRWKKTDGLLNGAFMQPIAQRVDDALLARMGLGQRQEAEIIDLAQARADRNIVPVAASPRNYWHYATGGAIAASVAVLLVVASNLGEKSGYESRAFAALMNGSPSQTKAALPDGQLVTVQLSFAAADGRYCREFSTAGGARPEGGIACKGMDGWQIEALGGKGAKLAEGSQIETADAKGNAALDSAYEKLGASDPLDVVTEKRLIARNWDPSRE